jgi:hypothetical protein
MLYCSNDELLADELAYLSNVFVENGYPGKIVHRILYEEERFKDSLEEKYGKAFELDFAKSFYVPYHPRARRLYMYRIYIYWKKNSGFSWHIRRQLPWEILY